MKNLLRWAGAIALALCATPGAAQNIDPTRSGLPNVNTIGSDDYLEVLTRRGRAVVPARTVTEPLGQLKRTMARALDSNPLSLPTVSGITVAQSATSDTALAQNLPLATSNALTATALNSVAWYGGTPAAVGGSYVAVPVTSYAPGNGNLSAFANASVTADQTQLTASMEVLTDSSAIEIGVYLNNTRRVFIQVNGQYVDTVGYTGAAAGNANSFIKVTGLTGISRVRVLFGAAAGAGATFPTTIRINALASLWRPASADVLRMAWAGDSYPEGTSGDNVLATANAPLPIVAGELLGIRDVRQVVAGGTGYIADNNGTRSKFGAQIPRWITAQGPFDLIVISHGYNDYSAANTDMASFTAEVLADLRLIRASSPAPIVVLGSWGGKRGPDQNTLNVETGIQAAVTQFNDPLCRFVAVSSATSPWQFGTGYQGATNGSGNSDLYVSTDGIHPNLAGHRYLGYRAANAIRAAVNAMRP